MYESIKIENRACFVNTGGFMIRFLIMFLVSFNVFAEIHQSTLGGVPCTQVDGEPLVCGDFSKKEPKFMKMDKVKSTVIDKRERCHCEKNGLLVKLVRNKDKAMMAHSIAKNKNEIEGALKECEDMIEYEIKECEYCAFIEDGECFLWSSSSSSGEIKYRSFESGRVVSRR